MNYRIITGANNGFSGQGQLFWKVALSVDPICHHTKENKSDYVNFKIRDSFNSINFGDNYMTLILYQMSINQVFCENICSGSKFIVDIKYAMKYYFWF